MDPLDRFDLVLRWIRRYVDLSQRELADWSGVPKSTIGDIESGRSRPTLAQAQQLLLPSGFALVLEHVGADDTVVMLPTDHRRDRGGRRVPPHLDVRERGRDERWALFVSGRKGYDPSPLTWRRDRDARDVLRVHGYFGDHPFRQPPGPRQILLVEPPTIAPGQVGSVGFGAELRTGLVAGFDDQLRWLGDPSPPPAQT